MVALTTFPPPSEGIHCQQDKTKAYIEQTCYGDGTIFIAEDRLSWVGVEGRGFSLEYPAISLHAVSRDLNSFPAECLFLMIDQDITDYQDVQLNGNESEGSDDDQDTSPSSVVRFVPEDKGKLDVMFGAMNECQILHPDEEDEDAGDEYYGGDGPETDENGGLVLSNQGHRTLEHLENIFNDGSGDAIPEEQEHTDAVIEDEPMQEEQFEDAD